MEKGFKKVPQSRVGVFPGRLFARGLGPSPFSYLEDHGNLRGPTTLAEDHGMTRYCLWEREGKRRFKSDCAQARRRLRRVRRWAAHDKLNMG